MNLKHLTAQQLWLAFREHDSGQNSKDVKLSQCTRRPPVGTARVKKKKRTIISKSGLNKIHC